LAVSARILVIDDDPAGLWALADALGLRVHDAVVDTAATAEAGLSSLSRKDYDVIICDVIMPGTDGVAFMQRAKGLSAARIILVTAGDLDIESTALYQGAYAFLPKPIDLDRLIPVVELALGRATDPSPKTLPNPGLR
jgi:DNA-binding NtrC family response regulator